jgi:hypothetical protein
LSQRGFRMQKLQSDLVDRFLLDPSRSSLLLVLHSIHCCKGTDLMINGYDEI